MVFQRRRDKPREERVRRGRARFEFRMELARDEVRVPCPGKLDDFHEPAVGGDAAYIETSGFQFLSHCAVIGQFVPVAVAFGYL